MALSKQNRNRNITLVVAVGAILGLLGVIAWTQFRGGDNKEASRELRAGTRNVVVDSLSELLQVDEEGFRDSFARDQLLEAARSNGVSEDQLMAASKDAAETYLDAQVSAGSASQNEADDVLDRLLQTIRDHL